MGECMVITSDQWDVLTRAISLTFLIAAGVGVFARFDLGLWEWRVRRYLRRRRISRIRSGANGR